MAVIILSVFYGFRSSGELGKFIRDSHERGVRFRSWVVPLRRFRFHHEPYRRETGPDSFIGREALCAEFLALLTNSQNSSGSYLVTGYRGVGKTSVVKKVLHDYADGHHHLNLRERSDLFGPLLMRCSNRCLAWRGKWLLWLHRRQAQRIRKRRDQGRTAPRFFWPIGILVSSVSLANLRWVFGFVLLILLVVSPTAPIGLSLIGVLVVVTLTHQFFKHRFAIFYPPNWWRWLARPVIPIHINLGHEGLDPKKILFGLVHVLRGSYREPFRLFSLATLVRTCSFAVLTLILAVVFYDLFRTANKYTETLLQDTFFSDLVISGEEWEPQKPCGGSGKEACVDYYRMLTAASRSNDRIQIKFIPLLPAKEFSADESLTNTSIPISVSESEAMSIAKTFDGDMNRARILCEHLPVGELALHQSLYCGIDAWLTDVYCHAYACGQNSIQGSDKDWPYLEDWFHFSLAELIKLIDGGVNWVLHGEEVSHDKLDAPRPYHLLFLLLVVLVLKTLLAWLGRGRVIRLLNLARERIVATDTVDVGASGSVLPLVGKRSRRYDPLDVRQTEALILDILEANRRIPRFLPRPDIIFVFDELDKINPVKGDIDQKTDARRGGSLNESVRQRKVEVEELLSNLKNLITVAPCRFIFIAGREMMDANLADQSANSHLYSSLFDKVIYVPSLLTDTSDGNDEDISSMVEQYVCHRLLPRSIAYYIRYKRLTPIAGRHFAFGEKFYPCWTLEVYADYLALIHAEHDPDLAPVRGKQKQPSLSDRYQRQYQELMSLLQDFVYYLTYRSGGTPKKLALQFERFVTPLSDTFLFDRARYHAPAGPLLPTTNFMLQFPPEGQYEIQLISQIFLLFHGDLSALIRKYGDKLAVATFSILDYLLKFHSLGFNSRDLERMPDFLDIHRAPALPQLVRLLLERLLAPYLRPVDNGIYEYRFLLHFQREVVYISQFSEQELAAFNFTLDESIAIKQHFHDFRDEQLRLRRELTPILWPQSVHSLPGSRRGGSLALPFIDVILGDLHGLDREYDQAQTEYRNALDGIEPALAAIMASHTPGSDNDDSTVAVSGSVPSFSHFLLYLRTLLKSGLIYEQRRQYDQAAGCYLQAKSLVEITLEHETLKRLFSRAENQIHLYAQPHVSLAFLYAKQDASLGRTLQHLDDAHAIRRRLDVQDPSSGESDRSLRGILYVRLYLRQAELLLFRSDLIGAACSFAKAARGARALARRPPLAAGPQDGHSESEADGKVHRLHLLGYALSGLGDAAAGLDLKGALGHRHKGCFFRDHHASGRQAVAADDCRCNVSVRAALAAKACRLKESLKRAQALFDRFGGHGEEPDTDRTGLIGCPNGLDAAVSGFLDDLLGTDSDTDTDTEGDPERCMADQRKSLTKSLCGRAVEAYVLSALVYRHGGRLSEASLSLWKAAYLFAFGFSYWRRDKDTAEPFLTEIWEKADKLLFEDSWRNEDIDEQEQCLVHNYAMQAFHRAYRIQRRRLKELGVEDPKLLKWVAPPLSQSMIVLGAFWHGFWRRSPDNNALGWDEIGIRFMGTFPVYPRILAGFLKGRWYFARAFPNFPELPSWLREDSTDMPPDAVAGMSEEDAVFAFRLLVDAVEDAEAYEGGLELLNPPLGFIYYHLWLTLYAIRKSGKRSILEDLRDSDSDSDEFASERKRFFEEDYIRVKAQNMLRDMLARHGNDEGFFAYADKHAYLTDSFSDPFVNGLWAVDMGLLPVARAMLVCLARSDKDGR
ncbi:ATP-binding protein [Candidatus Thiosymbion oneisti]|uniref:ATP-binding protein n=1 Tax=Candidatus Thiosymbion oneisti TaxID=589554 RepID=UPI000B7D9BF2|nr:ATP-binding protein [Candidatus Thiosymbion oneisti]